MHPKGSKKGTEWERWSPLTPMKEKRNRAGMAMTASPIRMTESPAARMVRKMPSEREMFKLFDAVGKPAIRHETDSGAAGKDHIVCLELA